MRIFLLAAVLAPATAAQTTVVGDALILGRLTAGTTEASTARLAVRASSAAPAAFQVSGVDLTPFWVIGSSGAAGASVTPGAWLDIGGSADSADAGLWLRAGSLAPSTGPVQVAFGHEGSANLRHGIRSLHSTTTTGGSLDFLLWRPADGASGQGSLPALSLVASSTRAVTHVMPAATTPNHDLVVSDGSTPGGGTIRRAAESTHSSRELKAEISYLGDGDRAAAYEAARALRHARFRYKALRHGEWKRDSSQPERRGLIYEDAPASLRGPGESVSLDARLVQAELAAQELMRRLEDGRARAQALEARR